MATEVTDVEEEEEAMDEAAGEGAMADSNSCQTKMINRCESTNENNVFAKSENKCNIRFGNEESSLFS